MTRFHYDPVIKDLFERDRPTVLSALAGGATVREFLNPEFASVEKRVADLLALLDDSTLLHIDFQSVNDPEMPYRMAVYGWLAAQKYKPPRIRQVVLYIGRTPLRMTERLDLGDLSVAYRLVDVGNEFEAGSLLQSGNPGDCALALLARGGGEHISEIVRIANRLPAPRRQRALAQLTVLSGLRGLSERLTMEFKNMGLTIDIEKNVILRDIRDRAKAEGIAEAMAAILRDQLASKFGPLPKWAAQRIDKASTTQLGRWARKVLTASTLEGVLGRK